VDWSWRVAISESFRICGHVAHCRQESLRTQDIAFDYFDLLAPRPIVQTHRIARETTHSKPLPE
jgi:hypothetical protein